MNQQATASQQKTRAEQETENEANRLREQVEAALAVVGLRSPDEVEALNLPPTVSNAPLAICPMHFGSSQSSARLRTNKNKPLTVIAV